MYIKKIPSLATYAKQRGIAPVIRPVSKKSCCGILAHEYFDLLRLGLEDVSLGIQEYLKRLDELRAVYTRTTKDGCQVYRKLTPSPIYYARKRGLTHRTKVFTNKTCPGFLSHEYFAMLYKGFYSDALGIQEYMVRVEELRAYQMTTKKQTNNIKKP